MQKEESSFLNKILTGKKERRFLLVSRYWKRASKWEQAWGITAPPDPLGCCRDHITSQSTPRIRGGAERPCHHTRPCLSFPTWRWGAPAAGNARVRGGGRPKGKAPRSETFSSGIETCGTTTGGCREGEDRRLQAPRRWHSWSADRAGDGSLRGSR